MFVLLLKVSPFIQPSNDAKWEEGHLWPTIQKLTWHWGDSRRCYTLQNKEFFEVNETMFLTALYIVI